MIIPKFLSKGDRVGLISTARKVNYDEIKFAIKLFEKWELKVVLSKELFNDYYQFAGKDAERTSSLQRMIDDKSIKAIICSRGGYGTIKIIDNVDFSSLQKNPKWILGYSDITILHCKLINMGIACAHTSMPINFSNNTNEAFSSLHKILFSSSNTIEFKPNSLNVNGEIKGQVVGGNLSILYSLHGSEIELNTKDKILFIEDVGEYLYHIDRMIISLKRANKLSNLKALIIGSMSEMRDNEIAFGKTPYEIIRDNLSDYNFPICFDFPAGHIKDNRGIILGKESYLKITSNGVILQQ